MQVCLWGLSEGRSEVVDSVWTGSVGFCQCSVLETSPGNHLLAFPGQQTEEVRRYEQRTTVCLSLNVSKYTRSSQLLPDL